MSSTGRKKKDGTKTPKRDKEFYATPIPAIFQLLDQPEIRELVKSKDFFYEPAAGDGAILDALRQKHLLPPVIYLLDIRYMLNHWAAYLHAWGLPKGSDNVFTNVGDYLKVEEFSPNFADSRLIITNPPFSLAIPMLQKSLREATNVIYLMRLDILGSLGRFEFWQQRHPDIYIMSKRYSFTGDGATDSCYYAWFWFHPKEGGKWKVI